MQAAAVQCYNSAEYHHRNKQISTNTTEMIFSITALTE